MKGFFKEPSSAAFICPCSNHLDTCALWDCSLASAQGWQYQSKSSLWKFILVFALYAGWRECSIRNGVTSRLFLCEGLLLYFFKASREAAALSSFGLGCCTQRSLGIEPLSWLCPVDIVPGRLCGHAQRATTHELGWDALC